MRMEEEKGYTIGTVIGERYEIVGLIGRGGMGEVYAVRDLRLQGKLRALKVNRPPTAAGHYSDEEAALLMRLHHPHLPLIVDYFPPVESGNEMLVMDYIDGITLAAYADEYPRGAVPEEAAIGIGLQLCEALHYLHMQHPPVIHRDLKPTNVMIDHAGFVRLIDFGIARRFKSGQLQDTVKLGTPGFAAPEQEEERQSDARTDIFGLGALLYYLLSGGKRRPDGEGISTRKGALDHVGARLKNAIGKMLDPEPGCRYATMAETGEALAACLPSHGPDESAGRAGPAGARSRTGIRHEPSGLMPVLPSGRLDSRRAAPSAMRSKTVHVTVASLSPGAGATFVAITLAKLLGQSGIDCAAIEHYAAEPQWHALLDIASRKGGETGLQRPLDPRYGRGRLQRNDPVLWHALLPEPPGEAADAALTFRLMLDMLEESISITDISSRWTDADGRRQLLESGIVLFVVDPHIAGWTPARLQAVQSVCFERDRQGLPTYWTANKDAKFAGRGEWLAMIPGKPLCALPLLPAAEWTELIWRGEWATSHKGWRHALARALRPFFDAMNLSGVRKAGD